MSHPDRGGSIERARSDHATERSIGDHDANARRVLDGLGITPQRFLDLERDVGRDAVSTVDRIEPTLVRPSRVPWPFSRLWRIDLDAFNHELRTALDAFGVGYCYMIRRKGRVVHIGSSGWAQLPDDGQVAWALHVPMNIASVSKLVTAIAAVRLLRGADIPLNTPIAGFLPNYWTKGEGISAITFHDLLRHEAGLGSTIPDSGTGTFAEARTEIVRGSTGTGTYDYKNVNFSILRVLFATLSGTLSPASAAPSFLAGVSDDAFWDVVSATVYGNSVNDYVLAPASIAPRGFEADENAAKAYATPPAAPGSRIEDGAGASGQSGWHMSIGELARLLGSFRAGAMMPRIRAQRLLEHMYGLDQPLRTLAGPVYTKGGRKTRDSQGMDSAIYLMPDGVDLAMFVNSWDGTGPGHLGTIPVLIEKSIKSVFSIVGSLTRRGGL